MKLNCGHHNCRIESFCDTRYDCHNQKPPCHQAVVSDKAEILRLVGVAKSDFEQHNWEKLNLVLNKIEEKLRV
jgi:hypothetical protein